jgi:hypothetical protein
MRTVLMNLALDAVAVGLFAPRINGELLRRATSFMKLPFLDEPAAPRECIVEERTSTHGIDVVSRVNYSQLARVSRSRGLLPDAPAPRRVRLTASRRELPASLREFPDSFPALLMVR